MNQLERRALQTALHLIHAGCANSASLLLRSLIGEQPSIVEAYTLQTLLAAGPHSPLPNPIAPGSPITENIRIAPAEDV